METFVQLKLFATLHQFMPENADSYPVDSGCTVRELLKKLNIPRSESKLIFINNVRADLETVLHGGERIGIFPPVGGG
ncbi:MAG: MoaD/ThiS family protein [Desulfobacteraceae bacterium]|jgi:molybdopterin converting factor small subunit